MMTSFDCKGKCANHHENGGWCAGLTSSNGHSTWCTALPQTGNWADITGEDWDETIYPPYVMESGNPACNSYKEIN